MANSWRESHAKEVEEWEKWRDLNELRESRLEENLVVASSDEEIVKFPTQHATTEISGEDEDEPLMIAGNNLNTIKEDFSNDLNRQHSADENLYECLVETRIGLCGKKNMGSRNHVRQDYGATP
ncbi:hypothetical protein Tco_0529757 [Tanacetum coccineum]